MIAIAVDDEPLMLGALVKAIKASPDITAVTNFTSCEDALDFIKSNPFGLHFNVKCGMRNAKLGLIFASQKSS